ncbi:hypothetical protein D9M68_320970 [compost metagenome]
MHLSDEELTSLADAADYCLRLSDDLHEYMAASHARRPTFSADDMAARFAVVLEALAAPALDLLRRSHRDADSHESIAACLEEALRCGQFAEPADLEALPLQLQHMADLIGLLVDLHDTRYDRPGHRIVEDICAALYAGLKRRDPNLSDPQIYQEIRANFAVGRPLEAPSIQRRMAAAGIEKLPGLPAEPKPGDKDNLRRTIAAGMTRFSGQN